MPTNNKHLWCLHIKRSSTKTGFSCKYHNNFSFEKYDELILLKKTHLPGALALFALTSPSNGRLSTWSNALAFEPLFSTTLFSFASLATSVLGLLPVAPSTASTNLSFIFDKNPLPEPEGDFFIDIIGFLPEIAAFVLQTTKYRGKKYLPGNGGVVFVSGGLACAFLCSKDFLCEAIELGLMALGSAGDLFSI